VLMDCHEEGGNTEVDMTACQVGRHASKRKSSLDRAGGAYTRAVATRTQQATLANGRRIASWCREGATPADGSLKLSSFHGGGGELGNRRSSPGGLVGRGDGMGNVGIHCGGAHWQVASMTW